jgi:hypothetical protein
MMSFFIANRVIISENTETALTATILSRLMAKLGGRTETTVMAWGCSDATISKLESLRSLIKGVLNIIKVVKLDINKMAREFVVAIQATAQAL